MDNLMDSHGFTWIQMQRGFMPLCIFLIKYSALSIAATFRNIPHHFLSFPIFPIFRIIPYIVCYIENPANIFLDFQRKKGYNEERKYP